MYPANIFAFFHPNIVIKSIYLFQRDNYSFNDKAFFKYLYQFARCSFDVNVENIDVNGSVSSVCYYQFVN